MKSMEVLEAQFQKELAHVKKARQEGYYQTFINKEPMLEDVKWKLDKIDSEPLKDQWLEITGKVAVEKTDNKKERELVSKWKDIDQ